MSIYVDPTIPRHTRRDLLDNIVKRGFDFSAAAMRDWQAKGLVADANQDRRWSDGRPGSDAGLWSENQRKSLIALLELRDRNRAEPHPRGDRQRRQQARQRCRLVVGLLGRDR